MVKSLWDRIEFFVIIVVSMLVMVVIVAQAMKAVDNAVQLKAIKKEKKALEARVKYLESMTVSNDDGSITVRWKE